MMGSMYLPLYWPNNANTEVSPLAPTLIESMFLPLYWPNNTHSIALSPNIDRKHVSTLILAQQYPQYCP